MGENGVTPSLLFDVPHRIFRRHVEKFDATSKSSTPRRRVRRHVKKFDAQHRKSSMLYWNSAQFNVLMPDCAPPVCFIALVKKWLQRRAGGRRTPGRDGHHDLARDLLRRQGAAIFTRTFKPLNGVVRAPD